MTSSDFNDPEFGPVRIKRLSRSKSIRVRVQAGGQLTATMPKLAPVMLLRHLIDSSRPALRKAMADMAAAAPPVYKHGDTVGASHQIVQKTGAVSSAKRRGQIIEWVVSRDSDSSSPTNQDMVRKAVRKALDAESKAYLPRRLSYLALEGGFSYSSVRYSNAKGRWGSCNSRGVISLNVALMNLPKELIDYVLVHELSHTRHLNHSQSFWQTVESYYPDYKMARKSLKHYSPYL